MKKGRITYRMMAFLCFAASCIMAIALLLMVAGCSQVTMSADYARQVELAAINVAELNRRCQGGDDVACKKGLAAASETLNLIVDAIHGGDSEGGDPNE